MIRTPSRPARPQSIRTAVALLAAMTAGVAALWPASAQSADAPLVLMTTSPVTFATDIAPVLNQNCVSCHRDGGGGPFSLMTYKDASKKAALLTQVTASHQMPPWKADVGYGRFQNERHLSAEQIDLFKRWADAGAPAGDLSTAPPPPTFDADSVWALGKPDLVVKMPQPFTVPADGRDLFRVFVLPMDLTEDRFVRAVEFRPSNKAVVHHSLIFLDRGNAAHKLEDDYHAQHPDDHQPGYPHFGGVGFLPSGGLGGWAPGALPSFLPDGVARALPHGNDLVVQLHFHPTGKPEMEQSEIGIYFSKTPPQHTLTSVVLRNRKIDIAPGETNFVVTDEWTTPVDITLVGITPHAHLVCRQMDVWATPKDVEETQKIPLIRIGDWDFNWQGTYRYATPVKIPAGTTLHMRYVYDNSSANERNPNSPPARIHFGEQTTDEMALCFLEGYTDRPGDTLSLKLNMLRRLRPGAN